MAKQMVTILTDDLDGTEADSTVEFGLDGVSYTIDLADKNAAKLRKVLEPYLASGSRVGRRAPGAIASRRSAVSSQTNRDQNQAIREWAAKNGFEVADRGRIPTSIVEAFHHKR